MNHTRQSGAPVTPFGVTSYDQLNKLLSLKSGSTSLSHHHNATNHGASSSGSSQHHQHHGSMSPTGATGSSSSNMIMSIISTWNKNKGCKAPPLLLIVLQLLSETPNDETERGGRQCKWKIRFPPLSHGSGGRLHHGDAGLQTQTRLCDHPLLRRPIRSYPCSCCQD